MNSNLVGCNPEGQPESLRCEQINTMLLNEQVRLSGRHERTQMEIFGSIRSFDFLEFELLAIPTEFEGDGF